MKGVTTLFASLACSASLSGADPTGESTVRAVAAAQTETITNTTVMAADHGTLALTTIPAMMAATSVMDQLTAADVMSTKRETTEESFEVSPWNLGGKWIWTLGFSEPPYNLNNFVNPGATTDYQITDGNYSGIIAGSNHWIDADYAVIGGGSFNSASGDFSTVRGGLRNTAKGDYSVVNGGAVNKIHSNYGTILGGYKNTVKGRFGTVLGGARNTAAGRFSVAVRAFVVGTRVHLGCSFCCLYRMFLIEFFFFFVVFRTRLGSWPRLWTTIRPYSTSKVLRKTVPVMGTKQ